MEKTGIFTGWHCGKAAALRTQRAGGESKQLQSLCPSQANRRNGNKRKKQNEREKEKKKTSNKNPALPKPELKPISKQLIKAFLFLLSHEGSWWRRRDGPWWPMVPVPAVREGWRRPRPPLPAFPVLAWGRGCPCTATSARVGGSETAVRVPSCWQTGTEGR